MSTTTNENSTESTGAASAELASHEVQLTDVAAGKVRSLLEQEGRTDLRLRVAVQPGGCSGLIYQLYFDERLLEGDAVRDYDGVDYGIAATPTTPTAASKRPSAAASAICTTPSRK
jgi:hypothetical protein